jgi:TonB family protein
VSLAEFGRKTAAGLLAAILVLSSVGQAQDDMHRKVRARVDPAYPPLARRLGIAGPVRLSVVVAPNGTIKEAKAIGGHPLLVSAALDAVRHWKFEAGTAETTETMQFSFNLDK